MRGIGRWPRRVAEASCLWHSASFFASSLAMRIVGLELVRHRLLPTVFAGQIAAVPLGADVVQLAQHAAPDRVHRVGVEDVVVPLVAGGQDQLGSGSATRAMSLHSWTLWAISFSVITCRPAFMAAMAAGACRCSGRAMMTPSRPSSLALLDQLLVAAVLVVVDLDVPAGLVLGLPAVLRHQSGPGCQRRLARMVAVEGPPDVVGADVGDRLDLDERWG